MLWRTVVLSLLFDVCWASVFATEPKQKHKRDRMSSTRQEVAQCNEGFTFNQKEARAQNGLNPVDRSARNPRTVR